MSALDVALGVVIVLAARVALSGMLIFSSMCAFACGSPASCNTSGSKLYPQGKYKEATQRFLRQVDLATGTDDRASLRMGLNNLALTAIRLRKPLEANAWIQVARDRIGDDSITKHNLALIQGELSHHVGSNLVGIYQRYAGYGRWSRLAIRMNANSTAHLTFNIVRYGRVSSADQVGPAALGTLETDAVLKDGHLEAAYAGDENVTCRFFLQPGALKMVVPNQDMPAQCKSWGGYSTNLDGTFWLVEEGLAQ